MKIFDLFGRKSVGQQPEKAAAVSNPAEAEIYPGMRVEVTASDGHLLFVAKLLAPHENTAELHQYSESGLSLESGPIPVKIRGYNDRGGKAVYMEGIMTPEQRRIWQVEQLTVAKAENDREFFRLNTNLDATITTFSGLSTGEKPCKLLNISVGGASIGSGDKHYEGDKFLLKVKLLEDRPLSVMLCQVLRVIEKGADNFVYGCQFLELTEEEKEKILQNIFAFQRKTIAVKS